MLVSAISLFWSQSRAYDQKGEWKCRLTGKLRGLPSGSVLLNKMDHFSRYITANTAPICRSVYCLISPSQDPEIIKLLQFGNQVFQHSLVEISPFPSLDHDLRFIDVDLHPCCLTLSCSNASWRPLSLTPSPTRLRLQILAIMIMNRAGDKG